MALEEHHAQQRPHLFGVDCKLQLACSADPKSRKGNPTEQCFLFVLRVEGPNLMQTYALRSILKPVCFSTAVLSLLLWFLRAGAQHEPRLRSSHRCG